jgi:hypothetical protein
VLIGFEGLGEYVDFVRDWLLEIGFLGRGDCFGFVIVDVGRLDVW